MNAAPHPFNLGGIALCAVNHSPIQGWGLRVEETGELWQPGAEGLAQLSPEVLICDLQQRLAREFAGDALRLRQFLRLPANTTGAATRIANSAELAVRGAFNAIHEPILGEWYSLRVNTLKSGRPFVANLLVRQLRYAAEGQHPELHMSILNRRGADLIVHQYCLHPDNAVTPKCPSELAEPELIAAWHDLGLVTLCRQHAKETAAENVLRACMGGEPEYDGQYRGVRSGYNLHYLALLKAQPDDAGQLRWVDHSLCHAEQALAQTALNAIESSDSPERKAAIARLGLQGFRDSVVNETLAGSPSQTSLHRAQETPRQHRTG